jgi:hypothetical protein
MWAFISSSLFLDMAKVHAAQVKGINKILGLHSEYTVLSDN